MAVLLRTLGIPARVAVGFTPGEPLPDGGGWRVTTDEYHAWVEVPFQGYGWLAFEPTPSRTNPTAALLREPAEPAENCVGPQCGEVDPGQEPPGGGPTPRGREELPPGSNGKGIDRRWLDPGGRPPAEAVAEPARRIGPVVAAAAAVAALLAVAAFLLLPPLRRARRRRAIARAGPSPRALVLAVYDASCRDARDRGVPRRPDETPEEYALAALGGHPRRLGAGRGLGGLAERAAYGPRDLRPDDVLDATADARRSTGRSRSCKRWRDRLPRRRSAA